MQYGEFDKRSLRIPRIAPRTIGDMDLLKAEKLPLWDGNREALGRAKIAFGLHTTSFESRLVKNEMSSFNIQLDLARVSRHVPYAQTKIMAGNVPILVPFAISYDFPERAFDTVERQISSLKNGYYELWPKDHNVSLKHHFPDPWGDATAMLDYFEKKLPIEKPVVNHNKIAARQADNFLLNELHLDGFQGMPSDINGMRLPIFRHFLNLGTTERTTALAIHDPSYVDTLVSQDYKDGYLDPLFEEMDRRLKVLILDMPGRDPEKKLIYGCKILTTHMIHGEYGPKGNMLAIVNSLR